MLKTMLEIEAILDRGGGIGKLAKKLGISREAIHKWKAKKRVPVTRVLEVEKITGYSRELIRPDIYPPQGKIRR